MNKTTTALTVLIEKSEEELDYESDSEYSTGYSAGLNRAIEIAISLLQKEREDMKFIYRTGVTNAIEAKKDFLDSGLIFNQSFTQYKTTDNLPSPPKGK